MASCTERGTLNLTRSCFRLRSSVFTMAFLLVLSFLFGAAAHGNGRFQSAVIHIVRPEHQLFGVQQFGLDPRPQELFGGHAVVAEKAAGGKGRGGQNAHPAHFLCAHIGLEQKINAHSHAEGKHRTDKLAGVESEKDGFAVFPNLFGDFDFDKTSPLSGK